MTPLQFFATGKDKPLLEDEQEVTEATSTSMSQQSNPLHQESMIC